MFVDLFVAFWNAIVIVVWVVPLLLIVFIATRKRWWRPIRAVLVLLIAGGYIAVVVAPVGMDYLKKKERAAFAKEAYAYFHKKCAEDSGRFIYKTVTEPQESVYMMKPRKKPTSEELRNQFWMGDPYGATAYLMDLPELPGLLGHKRENTVNENRLPMLSFVETHDLDDPDKLWRYYPIEKGGRSDTCPRGEIWKRCEAAESIQSRYGFTWDDLSTREDRHYWVAKSRLQIIDLQTQEVIAERIGYVIEGGFGFANPYGHDRNPWKDTEGGGSSRGHNWNVNFCPPRGLTSDSEWLRSVLTNSQFMQ